MILQEVRLKLQLHLNSKYYLIFKRCLTIGYGNSFVWVDSNSNDTSIGISNLCSIHEFLRDYAHDPDFVTTYESGFIGLLNVHSIYIHCPNLGHYNSVGVRGESSIIKKVQVSSSFGYLILDSVVAPHDKLDVSRQPLKQCISV